jgi:type I restriction enzyme R subunit
VSQSEKGFEDAIELSLLVGGYLRSEPSHFDRVLGLDTAELYAFIGATQTKAWEQLLARGYGNDANAAQKGFAKRLASEIDTRGTVDVLRHGVVDYGITIQVAYFKPAHGLTPDLQLKYEANRVTVTRQLRYETGSENSLDLALLVNGIPTATAELKNQLTGQNVEHAINQYRQDRDPGNVTLAKRAVVHFAVDPDRVAMSTRLEGVNTRFLPFNQGSGGAGNTGGAGNPPSSTGHRTAYLWEQVWQRDAWLDLLARFVHVEMPAKGSKAGKKKQAVTIFPRYHQWDAVRRLEADAKASGAGQNYLVQHSAGSGKSNTIAWICHRLSNLHDTTDTKVFDKVIVITDRIVLDRQLQDTIYQFEHAKGVVVKIDKNSAQLADALSGEQAKIIITTLQKFSYVLDKIAEAPKRRYAVVIDEAHSSQTGESAKDLRAVLSKGQDDDAVLVAAEEAEAAEEAARGDAEDQLAVSVAGRGRQPNISFFAFTATPKAKTLELFGRKETTPDGDRFVPFHLYSMRQAIEEKFILDVLANYTTYNTYWKIEKRITDDPEHDKAQAKAAIARFVSLHPTNLAQKAEIIVEHFRQHTAGKIGGKAKAMVVTSSRLHAVRYKLAIDKYIADKKYADVAALVAFSGKVLDGDANLTEASMNSFPDSETAERFDTDEYQVLIVAEKFQTGFDQPLLHTMYVDKVLTGLNAVQTLSRLNRIHPNKTDTFVLDFRNETADIQKAFAPWFERTEAIPTNPNLLWDTHRKLMDHEVIHVDEIPAAVTELLAGKNVANHDKVYARLDPALARFEGLGKDEQDVFRGVIGRFVSMYGFVAQIVNFTDAGLERDYVYSRALQARLGGGGGGGSIDIGSEIALTHLRTEHTGTGSASLTEGDGTIAAIFSGQGKQHDPELEPLSKIIDSLNQRFGTDLDDEDQLLFDQFEETWVRDPEVVAQAQNNEFENFRLVFDRMFMGTVIGRMDDNEAIFKRILDDDEFQKTLMHLYAIRVYRRLREGPETGTSR